MWFSLDDIIVICYLYNSCVIKGKDFNNNSK